MSNYLNLFQFKLSSDPINFKQSALIAIRVSPTVVQNLALIGTANASSGLNTGFDFTVLRQARQIGSDLRMFLFVLNMFSHGFDYFSG